MSAEEQESPGQRWPRELTPEEAAKLRAHYLALAREAGEQARQDNDGDDSESTDATVAAFVLPGD